MFSGIVETEVKILQVVEKSQHLLALTLERPAQFIDLKRGDSVAVQGVCLTVEEFSAEQMNFSVGAETLQITGWTVSSLSALKQVNVEQSLRFGDRIHGHLVSGHVDCVGQLSRVEDVDGNRFIDILVPLEFRKFFWRKGSWAVNGVSLTINHTNAAGVVGSCLIPETLKRTTLKYIKTGDTVNLEIDWMARGLLSSMEAEATI
jgi:riboflavin synthase